jgi:hypothetical protein
LSFKCNLQRYTAALRLSFDRRQGRIPLFTHVILQSNHTLIIPCTCTVHVTNPTPGSECNPNLRTCTERRLDTLCVNSHKFSGSSRNFPTACSIPAPRFTLKFSSDQSYEEWGWHFTVFPQVMSGKPHTASAYAVTMTGPTEAEMLGQAWWGAAG